MTIKRINIVVIGDSIPYKQSDAKTTLLFTYTKQLPEGAYMPVAFENYIFNKTIKTLTYEVGLRDTSGQENYTSLRHLSYAEQDVAILVYSVTDPQSFRNITAKWLPELKKYSPKMQVVLVGLNADKRDPQNESHITKNQGKNIARKYRIAFLEGSLEDKSFIDSLFNLAIDCVLYSSQQLGFFETFKSSIVSAYFSYKYSDLVNKMREMNASEFVETNAILKRIWNCIDKEEPTFDIGQHEADIELAYDSFKKYSGIKLRNSFFISQQANLHDAGQNTICSSNAEAHKQGRNLINSLSCEVDPIEKKLEEGHNNAYSSFTM